MNLYTIDFETYYSKEYSLSKMTTEEYVRDPRFETILVCVKENDKPTVAVDQPDIRRYLAKLGLHNHAVLAHHAHFDLFILNHHYAVQPALILDTLSMARALHGANGRLSLGTLSERYNLPPKGTEVANVIGMRRYDFDDLAMQRYAAYCMVDVDNTYQLFRKMVSRFPEQELKIIDMVVRMFSEPVLNIDVPLMTMYRDYVRAEKTTALLLAGMQLADVMSNQKLAAALEALRVIPPKKVSPTTGKRIYAFAKTDPAMEALTEHPDERVQALVAARLKNKTTINETRAERMIGMGQRGTAPIYLKYSGASGTHRLSGGDKMNWQNLGRLGPPDENTQTGRLVGTPRGIATFQGTVEGTTGRKLRITTDDGDFLAEDCMHIGLRHALVAPDGCHQLVVVDSSNIESRVLNWLAQQEDIVQVFRDADAGVGPDVYCVMGARIFGREIVKGRDLFERQMGKTAELGCGFQIGGDKFAAAVQAQTKKPLPFGEGARIVKVYRDSHPKVVQLWNRAQDALSYMANGEVIAIDPQGVMVTKKDGMTLPNGMTIEYPDLKYDKEARQWSFWNGKSREFLYGGKVVENMVQALARIVVMEQTLDIHQYYRVVLSVHDEAVMCVLSQQAKTCLEYSLAAFRKAPAWAAGLPLNSEGDYGSCYGWIK